MEIKQSKLLDWAKRLNNSGLGVSQYESLKVADEIAREACKTPETLRSSQLEDFHEEETE